jgi:hypothetical protein
MLLSFPSMKIKSVIPDWAENPVRNLLSFAAAMLSSLSDR